MKKFIAIAFVILLSACSGDTKEALGLRREGPDEFAVERKPKLEVPPSFKVVPPQPGQKPLNAVSPTTQARQALIGTTASEAAEKSEGESAILKNAGTDNADANIKNILSNEYNQEQNQDMLDRLQAISADNSNKTIVDPNAEKERIINNKKENKPITEGETPSKSINDDKSALDKLLYGFGFL